MSFELTASMMHADLGHLAKEVSDLEEGKIDSFHIEIMDGGYVANYALSINDLKCVRSLTDKPMDVHLMIKQPKNRIQLFLENLHKGDTVYIHSDSEYFPEDTLQDVIDAGMISGLAVSSNIT